MKKCMIIGRPNAGKTSFFISFIESLGIRRCRIATKSPEGKLEGRGYPIDLAYKFLVSQTPFKTKGLQEMRLSLKKSRGSVEVALIDSGGVSDSGSTITEIKASMLLTLTALQEAEIILHIIDASTVNPEKASAPESIDNQINSFGKWKGAYCILSSKMDLSESIGGLEILEKNYANSYIIPISSVSNMGLKEVRDFVVRNI